MSSAAASAPPAGGHATPGTLGPVGADQRIEALDVIRGVSLLGILLVNMAFFASPVFYDMAAGVPRFEAGYDRAAAWLIRFLGEGKFYSLFSFLFGLGLFLQMSRAEARGVAFVPLYARRLLVLLAIGLAHAFSRPLLRRVLGWGLGIGLVGNALFATLSELSSRFTPTVLTLVAQARGRATAPPPWRWVTPPGSVC
jgi:hypothetical protein